MGSLSVLSFFRGNWLLLIVLTIVLGFAGIHVLWYIHPSDVQSVEDLNTRLVSGQPTIVEFYSNL